ncbi:MAG: chromosome segregation protein SMC [Candidatus Planktophila sp.]
MYLKSLTLKGFKSFAQPSTFHFEPGVTAVIGKNGHGKSNVFDAIAWVMGEQGAKSLRGDKMEDVIFKGSATKGPLGRAEVELTIDNADGALPIDYSEVTISRTLFRNGQSEYAINGDVVRLLDVQELLSDSGLGREMHVIVPQGKLKDIFQASPIERRGFIEEAAGILKHRRRKEKTERKLESMQANFTRLNDLAGEVRRQLKPLGAQAAVAREAQTIAINVRDSKARLLAADIAELIGSLETSSKSENESKAEQNILKQLVDSNTARIRELEAALISTEYDAARNVSFSFDSLADRLRALLTLANQRVALLGSRAEANGATVDPAAIDAEATAAEAALITLAEAATALEGQLREAEAKRSVARDQLEAYDSQIAEQNQLLSAFDLEKARLSGEVSMAESKVAGLRSELVRHEAALGEARDRRNSAQTDLETLDSTLQSQQSHGDNSLQQRHDAATRAVADSLAQIERIRDEVHAAERERDSLEAKRSALDLTLAQKDGASELTSAGLRGIRGLVANHMKIETGYEVAVGAALGPLADALVADTRDEGLAALEHLKRNDGGRVELIVADVDTMAAHNSAEQISGARAAASVVEAPAGVIALLRDVVIVDDLAAAQELYRRDKSVTKLTVITKDGDVLTESILRGGSQSKPSKVQLVAERDAAATRISQVNSKLETLRGELTQARATEDAAKQTEKQALAALKQHDSELAKNADAVGRARVAVEAIDAELSRLSANVEQARSAIDSAEQTLQHAISIHDQFAAQSRPVVSYEDRQRLADNVEQERSNETQIRIELGSAAERLRVEKERARTLRAQVAEAQEAIERAQAAAAAQQAQLDSARKVLEALPMLMDAVADGAGAAKAKLHEIDHERNNQNGELVRLRGETADLQMKLSGLTQGVHDLELKTHEKRINLANLVMKSSDELGLDEPTLLAEYGPQVLIEDPENPDEPKPFLREEQQKRLRENERLLDRLGKVNPLALEEFAALEERHKNLATQLDDIVKTRADLQQIIKDLDEKMQTIFKSAFDDTKREFESILPILFPGGAGSMTLTEPDNLLATGIDVRVKPAGKQWMPMSLLSGGEQSLGAIAFLTAIFKSRPSPFYIMDEVEAALDDVNLTRLLHIFQDLRKNSQLILVTHQKRTMEIADVVYGVTMLNDGISRIVGQRLGETA